MPSVEFVLPHWLYWAGLIVFPLVAMYLSRQVQPAPGSRSVGIAYFIWIVGGFFGFHRLYLKNKWGILYWPLFAIILFSSSMEREARVVYSDAVGAVTAIETSTKRFQRRITKATGAIDKAQTRMSALASDDERGRKRQQRAIDKATKTKTAQRAQNAGTQNYRSDRKSELLVKRRVLRLYCHRSLYAP